MHVADSFLFGGNYSGISRSVLGIVYCIGCHGGSGCIRCLYRPGSHLKCYTILGYVEKLL